MELKLVNKLCQIKLGIEVPAVQDVVEESVVVVINTVSSKVVVAHCLEQETEDAMRELGLLACIGVGELGVHLMHHMHFKVHELAIDGVLRWRVEMRLQTVQIGLLDMMVEEIDGLRLHHILLGFAFHHELELLACLLVLSLLLGINGLVFDGEVFVLEVGHHGGSRLKVDRCSLLSKCTTIICLLIVLNEDVAWSHTS